MELLPMPSTPRSSIRSEGNPFPGPNLVLLDRVIAALEHHLTLVTHLLMSAPCHLESVPCGKHIALAFARPAGVLEGRRMVSNWLSECDPCGATSLEAQIADSDITVRNLVRTFFRDAFGVDPYLPFAVAWPGDSGKHAMLAFGDISSIEAKGSVVKVYGRLRSGEPSAASVLCVATFSPTAPVTIGLGPNSLPLPKRVTN
jgi:hypothetical protein